VIDLQQFAGAEDRDLVAQLDGFVDVVADHDHGLVQRTLHFEEFVLDHLAVDRVDGAEGFVHQQQRRIGGQRADHPDPLLLTTGQFTRIAMQILLGFQLDHAHQFASAVVAFLFVPAEQLRHDHNVFLDGHVGEQADLLDHIADVATQGHFVEARGVFAVDQHLAGGRHDQAVDHFQRRTLAATRGAEEYADFALVDGQAH
jgi:hypothetical protein